MSLCYFCLPNLIQFANNFFLKKIIAGKKTDEEEIERMLESGNPQIFTEGVIIYLYHFTQNLFDSNYRSLFHFT